jgi:hypothetical protein
MTAPIRALLGACALLLLAAAPATAATEHSENLTHVKTIGYEPRNGGTANYGTDIEFTKVGGREYALAGSYRNGMQIVDITDPTAARKAATYDCGITQGDVQVFRQKSKPGRVFAGYTSDTFGDGTSTCYREAAALGFDVNKDNGQGKNGTFIVELTDPLNPRTVSFVEVAKGSHNHTIHPSGDFLYNSNSDLITSLDPHIEVFDIRDFATPKNVANLKLPVRPGLGTESHDITFNKSGSRAYSAALSQGVIIDTTNPAAPSIVSSFLDPAINVWHQSDPVTLKDSAGREREFLLVEDEVAGAAGGPICPTGGVHVYDITGAKERNPEKVGYWNIDDVQVRADPLATCTAHVFDIHQESGLMTIAYYMGGVRVVDLKGLVGVSLGETQVTGEGMKEVGFYRFDDANTWAAKTPKVHPKTGDFFLYGNDIDRGLDIYRFKGAGKPSKSKGKWKTPAESRAHAIEVRTRLAAAGVDVTDVGNSVLCLIGR